MKSRESKLYQAIRVATSLSESDVVMTSNSPWSVKVLRNEKNRYKRIIKRKNVPTCKVGLGLGLVNFLQGCTFHAKIEVSLFVVLGLCRLI